jgi:hypothetical protein
MPAGPPWLARSLALSIALALPAAAEDAPGPWAVPPEGGCEPAAGLRIAPDEDATAAFPFKTGDGVTLQQLEALRNFLPKPLWEYRERFFYEGMRLEIGPCFRDYSPPAFFVEATEKNRDTAKLDTDGGLAGWHAGLPFPPDAIDPKHEQAGARWAWNVAGRYQAAGFRSGRFRVVDLLGRVGRAEPFVGEMFRLQLSHRADLAASDYQVPFASGKWWVAGGKFMEPFNAREYAWRQYRSDDAFAKAQRTDDLHAYLPQWRRVRRISASNVEGLYMPSFSVGVVPAQQLAVAGGAGAAGGVVAAGGLPSDTGSTLQTRRSGFEGLELRPLLWRWRVVGVQDLIAPINLAAPMYPEEPEREFGPWGLSFASDRWDVRRALVLEGKARGEPGQRGEARVIWYFDLQTLQPLFYLAYDAKDEPIDVGVFAGRWSEDRPDYPRWPDDPERPVRVIDSMGAAFANLAEDGSWRRESWNLVGTPPSDKELRQLDSSSNLTKGR